MTGKSRSRKSGREKLNNPPVELPKVVSVPAKFQKQMGGKRVLVPTPRMVDADRMRCNLPMFVIDIDKE